MACGSPKKDAELVCNAEARWEASEKPGASLDPGQRPRLIFLWLGKSVSSGAVKKDLELAAALPRATQAERVQAIGKEHGISPCPFAESLAGRPEWQERAR